LAATSARLIWSVLLCLFQKVETSAVVGQGEVAKKIREKRPFLEANSSVFLREELLAKKQYLEETAV